MWITTKYLNEPRELVIFPALHQKCSLKNGQLRKQVFLFTKKEVLHQRNGTELLKGCLKDMFTDFNNLWLLVMAFGGRNSQTECSRDWTLEKLWDFYFRSLLTTLEMSCIYLDIWDSSKKFGLYLKSNRQTRKKTELQLWTEKEKNSPET